MTELEPNAGLWVSPQARERSIVFDGVVRHSLVCIASGQYESPAFPPLDVKSETRVLRGWLTTDRRGLPGMVDLSPPVDPLLSQVQLAVRDEDGRGRFRAGDAVFVYVTGHGFNGEGGHRLALKRTVPAETGSAYRTVELLSALKDGGVEHAVVVVDTCDSGQTASDLAGYSDLPSGWLVLFTAGKHANAGVGALTSALEAFLAQQEQAASGPLGLAAEPYLHPRDLYLALNDALYAAGQRLQHAGQFPIGAAVHPCLPNPGYDPDRAPSQVDGAGDESEGVLSRAVSASDLDAHWAPRALGSAPGTTGDHFSDRPALMRVLIDRVRSGSGLVVLTGRAGCGKSSALSRLVALSDAVFRAAHPGLWSDLPSDVLPRQGDVDLAVLAKGRSTAEVLTQLADGLGSALADVDGVAEALRGFVRRTGRRATVVIDAVDESRDARGLAAALAELGEQGPPVRLLVGVRGQRGSDGVLVGVPAILAGAWKDAEVLGADEPPLWTDQDLADYARRLLLASPSTPFVDDEHTAAVAAELARLAGRSYLLVQFAARNLAAQGARPPSAGANLAVMFADGLVGLLREDLERALPDLDEREAAEDLLIGCAFAIGAGTPWRAVWARLAGAVSVGRNPTRTYGDRDVAWLLSGRLAGFLVQDHADGEAVFRPFHDELATALRSLRAPHEVAAGSSGSTANDEASVHRRIVAALRVFANELHPGSSLDDVPSYVRRHLTDHASKAGTAAQLLAGSAILAVVDPRAAGRLAEEVSLEPPLRAVLERIAGAPSPISPGRRAAEVELWSQMESVPAIGEELKALTAGQPWRAAWADLSPTPASRVLARTPSGRAHVLLSWTDPVDGAAVCLIAATLKVRLVSVATGEELAACPVDTPTSAAMSPAGDLVVIGTWDGEINLLDGHTLGVMHRWQAHTAPVYALAIATDDDDRPVVLSGAGKEQINESERQGLHGEVACWELGHQPTRPRWKRPVFGNGVYGLVGVGQAVAAAGDCFSEPGREWDLIRVLRLDDGQLLAAVPHDSRGIDVAVAVPGLDRWVAVRRHGQGVFLVDTARAGTVRSSLCLDLPLWGPLGTVPAAADSGGPWLVFGVERGLALVAIRNVDSEPALDEQVLVVPMPRVQRCASALLGGRLFLLTLDGEGVLRRHQLSVLLAAARPAEVHAGFGKAPKDAPDRRAVSLLTRGPLPGSLALLARDARLEYRDLSDGRVLARSVVQFIARALVSLDDVLSRAVVAGDDSRLYLVAIEDNHLKVAGTVDLPGRVRVTCLRLMRTADRVALGFGTKDGRVGSVWLDEGQPPCQLVEVNYQGRAVTALAVMDHELFAGDADGSVVRVRLDRRTLEFLPQGLGLLPQGLSHVCLHHDRVRALAITCEGAVLVSAGDEGDLLFTDLTAGTTLTTPSAHSGRGVTALVASQAGLLVSGGRDGKVRFWRVDPAGARLLDTVSFEGSVYELLLEDNLVVASTSDGPVALRLKPGGWPVTELESRF